MVLPVLVAAAAFISPCIGRPIKDCFANILQNFEVDDWAAAEVNAEEKTDVNGKRIPLSPNVTMLSRKRGIGESKRGSISLNLDENRRVKYMTVTMPADPMDARTETEYDSTEIADYLGPVIGQCFATKVLLYRFFENSI